MTAHLSEKCFGEILEMVHQLTGITISKNRNTMIEGRLRKRLISLKMTSYEEYLNLLKSDLQERDKFIDLVTTNETYFFRTPRIWDYIEAKVLPEWIKKYPKKQFLAWSAAASSGEEAHSLGVVLQNFKEKNPTFQYQIVGTDISSEMVALCKKGEYSGRSIDAFRKNRGALFQKFMIQNDKGAFSVIPEIKKNLRFEKHNLFKSFKAKDKFDLILIRNVLIYFTPEDQQTVLGLLGPQLAQDGVLIIGESESLSHIKTSFQYKEPLIYQGSSEPGSDPTTASSLSSSLSPGPRKVVA